MKNLKKPTVIQTEIETLLESILELTGLKVLEVGKYLPIELPERTDKLCELKSYIY